MAQNAKHAHSRHFKSLSNISPASNMQEEDAALKQNQNITNQEFKLVIKQKTGRNEQKV